MFDRLRSALFGRAEPAGAPDTWYLQSGGEIYGPVPMSELQEWAKQARIPAGGRVSMEGSVWHPAEDIEALRLDWLVDLPDGSQYGPVNLHALPILVENGELPEAQNITHVETGRRSTVEEELKSERIAEQSPAR